MKSERVAGNLGGDIPPELFRRIAERIHREAGIVLGEEKRGFVATRIRSLPGELGLPDLASVCEAALGDEGGPVLSRVIDCVSTNHTFFYRESAHFDHFRELALPEITSRLRSDRDRDLRVWCAAASTGEEPYTLAMIIRDHLGRDVDQWRAGLLATDISERALAIARRGLYPPEAVERLPQGLRQRYFRRHPSGALEVVPELRQDVVLRRFNLLRPSYPFRRPFHAIFCRNVMIYFDAPTRESIVARLFTCTEPGGYLYLGMAETIRHARCPFEFVRPAVYRRPEA